MLIIGPSAPSSVLCGGMVRYEDQSPQIKPNEVEAEQEASIPEEVFEAFNDLIVKNMRGGWATVMQPDVVQLIKAKFDARNDGRKVTSEEIFSQHWLDVEQHYHKAGWTVEYDKPAYNESYEASFTFKKKAKPR